jgi:colanic acid/amylovoran biosynthesis glycosyltransferase
LKKVIVFAERMLPSTQTFIPVVVDALTTFTPQYAGLIPAEKNYPLNSTPILLTPDRSLRSRVRREAYRWTGASPAFHRRLAKTNPDILHAHFAESAGSAVSIARALDIPMVLHLRGGAEMHSDDVLRSKLFQRPYLRWREQLWQRGSLFLCVSEFIRRKAIEAGFPEDKLRVHYTGIEMSRFTRSEPVPERDRNLILYVGRLVKYKGGDQLLRAMQIVRRTNPEARLAVIGDGEFRPHLEALAVELQVPTEFLGEKTAGVVRSWLERARVFCGPSVTLEDGMSEAFGNVFTEAQAMGLPVVSYRHGGITETMLDGKTGLLADEYDYQTLAANLDTYLRHDQAWESAHELGMRWVRENFDVRVQTRRLEEIYDEVIAAYAPRRRQATAV